jgi:hypothetical protein
VPFNSVRVFDVIGPAAAVTIADAPPVWTR